MPQTTPSTAARADCRTTFATQPGEQTCGSGQVGVRFAVEVRQQGEATTPGAADSASRSNSARSTASSRATALSTLVALSVHTSGR